MSRAGGGAGARAVDTVSVVVPLYNKEAQVARALRSILEQSAGGLELLVVDDGSTDGGRAVAAALAAADARVRVIDQPHAGVSAARNRGIAAARHGLVAFCDADDEWERGHLEALLGLARRHPEAAVFATGYWFAGAGGARRANILRGLPAGFEEGLLEDYFGIAAVSDPPLHTSSVAARVEALRAVGLFPAGVDTGEDLVTWARLAARYRIAYLLRPTAVFHAPGGIGERPGRVPAARDPVGEELARLGGSAPAQLRAGIAAYGALWHRMRGVILLKLGRGREARAQFGRSLRVGGWSARAAALWLLCLVPGAGRAVEPMQRLRERRRGGAAAPGDGAARGGRA